MLVVGLVAMSIIAVRDATFIVVIAITFATIAASFAAFVATILNTLPAATSGTPLAAVLIPENIGHHLGKKSDPFANVVVFAIAT